MIFYLIVIYPKLNEGETKIPLEIKQNYTAGKDFVIIALQRGISTRATDGTARMEYSTTNVDINYTLQDTPYLSNVKDKSLCSIVCRRGSQAGGHYWTYIKLGNIWYKCDDSRIEVASRDGKILEPWLTEVNTQGLIFIYATAEAQRKTEQAAQGIPNGGLICWENAAMQSLVPLQSFSNIINTIVDQQPVSTPRPPALPVGPESPSATVHPPELPTSNHPKPKWEKCKYSDLYYGGEWNKFDDFKSITGNKELANGAVIIFVTENDTPKWIFGQREIKRGKHVVSFPGGQRDWGEHNISNTIYREFEEETGYNLNNLNPTIKQRFIFPWKNRETGAIGHPTGILTVEVDKKKIFDIMKFSDKKLSVKPGDKAKKPLEALNLYLIPINDFLSTIAISRKDRIQFDIGGHKMDIRHPMPTSLIFDHFGLRHKQCGGGDKEKNSKKKDDKEERKEKNIIKFIELTVELKIYKKDCSRRNKFAQDCSQYHISLIQEMKNLMSGYSFPTAGLPKALKRLTYKPAPYREKCLLPKKKTKGKAAYILNNKRDPKVTTTAQLAQKLQTHLSPVVNMYPQKSPDESGKHEEPDESKEPEKPESKPEKPESKPEKPESKPEKPLDPEEPESKLLDPEELEDVTSPDRLQDAKVSDFIGTMMARFMNKSIQSRPDEDTACNVKDFKLGLSKKGFQKAIREHVTNKFKWLDQQAKGGRKILIPGNFGKGARGPGGHQLGYGFATQGKSGGQWGAAGMKKEGQQFLQFLDAAVQKLLKDHPKMVTVAPLAAKGYDIVLWGANAGNYYKPGGAGSLGGGQAKVIGDLKFKSVTTCGIITTPAHYTFGNKKFKGGSRKVHSRRRARYRKHPKNKFKSFTRKKGRR